LRFRPSTLPLDTTPPVLNQFNKSARCFSRIRATRFIGSILDVIVRLIHPFKNFSAHVGDRYFKNWFSVRFTLFFRSGHRLRVSRCALFVPLYCRVSARRTRSMASL